MSHIIGKKDLALTGSNGQRHGFCMNVILLFKKILKWLVEAVFQFYQMHLDNLIRENDRMWGDFCKKKYDDRGNELGLGLNTFGFDMTLHEAFHQPASGRTKARDLDAGEFHTSTKLDGYVWVANAEKIAHVPKDQADDLDMEDDDDDDDDQDDTTSLPSLQVTVRPQAKVENEEGVSSLQKEETPQPAVSDDDEVVFTDRARINGPEDRYGCFIVRQLKTEHHLLLKEMCINSQVVLSGDDLEGRSPLRPDEIGYFSLLFFMEYAADTSLTSFMETFVTSTQTEISYDDYHDFHLEIKRVIEANKHITVDNFEDVEEPDLNDDDPNIPLQRQEGQHRGDPEFKGKLEI